MAHTKKKEKPKIVHDDAKHEQEEEEEKERGKKSNIYFLVAIGFIIVGIAVFITIPTLVHKIQLDKNTYNKFIFQKNGRFWMTEIERNNLQNAIPFYFHPRELEDIPAELNLSGKILPLTMNENASIIITLDPNLNTTAVQAGVQISRITGERYHILNIQTRSAITNPPANYVGNATFPLATCKDATNATLVIWLRKGMVNGIFSEGNCIVVQGKDEDELLRSAEKFTYLILGIMDH
jgi:hypothetical protein